MPVASSTTLNLITVYHGVAVYIQSIEFNESTGIMRVRAVCADATVASDYVEALYDNGVARSVEYRGYGSTSDGLYTFTIDVTLKTGGAR